MDQAEALTDVIASLKTPDDLDTMVQRMTKFFRDNGFKVAEDHGDSYDVYWIEK